MNTLNTNVDLHVCVNDNKVAEYLHEGRCYVEAKEGTEYSIRVRNNNPFRVKIVLSVDGVCAITGKPVTDGEQEAGYILGAHESQTIKGYRLDNNAVAAFKFVKAEAGYAKAEKGLSGTTGVIGLRVYKERVIQPPQQPKVIHHHHHHNEYWIGGPYKTWDCSPFWYSMSSETTPDTIYSRTSNANLSNNSMRCMAATSNTSIPSTQFLNCSAQASSLPEVNPFNAGSTFGSKVDSRVTEVSFLTECCLGTIEIFYSFKEGLKILGVDLSKTPKVVFPTAFSDKYARPPANWQG